MADIRPFRGIRFNSEVAGDLSANLCPTYVLSDEELRALYDGSDYNVIRLELAYDWSTAASNEARYMRSARTRTEWLMAGALKRDPEPSLYVVEEAFTEFGASYRRIGLVAAVRVEDYDAGIVLPHEKTEAGPTEDRFSLLRSTWANFSPLMVMYRDGPDAPVATLLWKIARREPDVVANPPDQPSIRMWCVTDPSTIGALTGALAGSQIYIADGHHRYGAAMLFRDYSANDLGHGPDAASQFRMMTLIAIDDPGLFLQGYHRGISGTTEAEVLSLKAHIGAVCDLEEWTPPQNNVGLAFEHRLAREPESKMVFGLAGYEPGKFHVATMKSGPPRGAGIAESTDYGRLHGEILRGIFGPSRELYVVGVKHSSEQAVCDVIDGESQFGFVMRPIPQYMAEEVILEGKLLPVKSTYFHPKLSAGLVIQSLEGEL